MRELEALADSSMAADVCNLGPIKKEELQDGDTGGPPPPPTPSLFKVQDRIAPKKDDSDDTTLELSSEERRISPETASQVIAARAGRGGGRSSRRARKGTTAVSVHANRNAATTSKASKAATKEMRKWGTDGLAEEEDGSNLDYSLDEVTSADGVIRNGVADEEFSGKGAIRTNQGQHALRDIDNEVSNILNAADHKQEAATVPKNAVASSLGVLSGYFRQVVGGKTLTATDLAKPLKAMEEHLIRKNVAREAAVRICSGVEIEMVGKKTGSFESIDKALRPAMESSLRRILTPTTSLDLLQEISAVIKPSQTGAEPRPYVMSIVGVNGVGKSTNLAKICYFLLQNDLRILVAACDTFRSGAVEQLNHHVRNLKELSVRERTGAVELYQKGYGKDAANVAKDAVTYASTERFDVVLIDTAGRRHNDVRLMSSLEKFANFAQPDKILMVGEALVGTDSVMQARNFNAAFGSTRNLDGFIISKCDTVGDMIGTLVSMVHATGIPVVFLGVGQHYGDLRNLSISWAVNLLMS